MQEQRKEFIRLMFLTALKENKPLLIISILAIISITIVDTYIIVSVLNTDTELEIIEKEQTVEVVENKETPIAIDETVKEDKITTVEEIDKSSKSWEIIKTYHLGKINKSMSVVPNEDFQQTVETDEIAEDTFFEVSPYNRNALIHLLFFEACSCNGYEDVLEQRAVISVVFNRLLSNKYPHCYDVSDIIFFQYEDGSYAFTPASDKNRFWNFKDENEKKDFENNYNQLEKQVDYVIEHGCTVDDNVLYFVSNKCYGNNNYFKNNHKLYCVYDGTTFMTTEKP